MRSGLSWDHMQSSWDHHMRTSPSSSGPSSGLGVPMRAASERGSEERERERERERARRDKTDGVLRAPVMCNSDGFSLISIPHTHIHIHIHMDCAFIWHPQPA